MKPEETDSVLRWFGRFKEASVIVYEMIGLEYFLSFKRGK
jgi:[phosphatase 2A protein]-leucine-carboxy methyltransferase